MASFPAGGLNRWQRRRCENDSFNGANIVGVLLCDGVFALSNADGQIHKAADSWINWRLAGDEAEGGEDGSGVFHSVGGESGI